MEELSMVACARAELADPREVEVFHIWNRVVRRARLCGEDPYTGKNYDYRRDWITGRERLLAQLFGIDVAFHAELSNHIIHRVLRTRPDIVRTWSDEEVIRRWLSITKLTRNFADVIVHPYAARVRMKAADAKYVADVRLRLSSISYFMAELSEPLSLAQYVQLLDFTGRQLRADKRGAIPSDLRPILERLHIRPDRWLDLVNSLDSGFRRALGRLESLVQAVVAAGRRWLQGVGQAVELFTA